MISLTLRYLLLVAVLAPCARAQDVVATRSALMEADRAFNRATAARRTDGWVEFFAEDGAMIRGDDLAQILGVQPRG